MLAATPTGQKQQHPEIVLALKRKIMSWSCIYYTTPACSRRSLEPVWYGKIARNSGKGDCVTQVAVEFRGEVYIFSVKD
jgi:hypothetical protein